jgi:hypothetical protein
MTNTLRRNRDRAPSARRRLRWVASAVVAPLLAMSLASSATALTAAEKEQFLQFADCPLTVAKLCVVSDTTGGEFIIGTSHKAVPLSKPILLQGGLATESYAQQPLLAATDGSTLAKVPEEVPGGLTGLGVGGELTATAELAGPASAVLLSQTAVLSPGRSGLYGLEPAVVLPLKVHLQNELLGENCYVGSDEEPILLQLFNTGQPEKFEQPAKGKILKLNHLTISDKSFSVPAAKGCGSGLTESLVTTLVNDDVGLPSPAGENTAVMSGSVAQTKPENALKYLPKKKKEKRTK